MKKILLFALLFTGILLPQTTLRPIDAVKEITAEGFSAAVLLPSPDGRYIAIGGFYDDGLWLYDTREGTLKSLSETRGIAWGFAWNGDGTKIAVRENYWAPDGMSKNSRIALLDLAGNRTAVTNEVADVSLPCFSKDGTTLWYKEEGKMWKAYGGSSGALVLDEGSVLNAQEGTTAETVTALVGFTEVLRAVENPVATTVLLHAAGEGIYLVDVTTGKQSSYGKGEYPVWITPERFSYVAVYDDGRAFTGTKIFVASVTGTVDAIVHIPGHPLTFYPVITKTGSVFFTDDNGRLFTTKVQLPD